MANRCNILKLKYCVSERPSAFSCACSHVHTCSYVHRSLFLSYSQLLLANGLDSGVDFFCFIFFAFPFPSGLTLFFGGIQCCSERYLVPCMVASFAEGSGGHS